MASSNSTKKISYIVVGILMASSAIIGAVYVLTSAEESSDAPLVQQTQQITTPQTQSADDSAATPTTIESVPNEAASPSGYITLGEYSQNVSAYTDTKKVYFFHAPWCSICQGIDKEITADPSVIPSGTVIIKTDFDSNTDLRKKYGVTSQYTFVQFDNDANELKQWSALNLEKALAGIQ